jgi:phosphotransferase system IIB component
LNASTIPSANNAITRLITNENNPKVIQDNGIEINFNMGFRKVLSKMSVIIKIKNGFKESIDVKDAFTSIYSLLS